MLIRKFKNKVLICLKYSLDTVLNDLKPTNKIYRSLTTFRDDKFRSFFIWSWSEDDPAPIPQQQPVKQLPFRIRMNE